jgi:diguanylate cyclase (GGDEF)-like protein
LLVPIVAAILLAGTVRTFLVFQEEVAYAERQLHDKARFIEQSVVLALSGATPANEERIRDLLASISATENVKGTEWRRGDTSIVVSSPLNSAVYPDWFARLAAIEIPKPVIPFDGGSTDPIELTVTFDGEELLAKAWDRIKLQAYTVGMVIAILIVAIMLILRSSLRGLQNLRDVAEQIQQGQYYARAEIQGSKEIKLVATIFNRMIDAVAQEIVVRKSSETRLREERSTLAGILDAMEEIVLLVDAQGRVELANPALGKLLDVPLTENLTGKTADELLPIHQSDGTPLDWCALQQTVSESGYQRLDNLIFDLRGVARVLEGTAIGISETSPSAMILVLRDVSEIKRLLRSAEWHATHDPLTGLPNRYLLSDRLSQACHAALRQSSMVAVGFFDLDGFKPVNDVYGHRVGDQLLTECARRIESCLRGMDTVVRLGGDEFVVLLTGLTNEEQIVAGIERILAVVAQPYEISGTTLKVTASFGVTVFPSDRADPDTLLRHADQAMYAAKAAGRDNWKRYLVADGEKSGELLEHLATALQMRQLELYYQPQVNIRSGHVTGMEALMRWNHPERGLLSPGEFLPAAERSSLIEKLGDWALSQALDHARQWHEAGLSFSVAVNIAGRHFLNPSFIKSLKTQLSNFPDLPPYTLRVEITESSALADMASAATVVRECQSLKVGVAIDDFGTGYASLSYLRQLPVDELKIDQHFVRDILDDKNDLALVEAIISLAKVFERQVLAEGVETPEQGILLMRLGCDLAQGYGIARPMPFAAVSEWCRNWKPDPALFKWANVHWNIVDFPLMMAQYDHLRWINRIMLHLEGRPLDLSEEELNDHHRCRFGIWYDCAGKDRYGHLREFHSIDAVHQDVHRLGQVVVDLLRQGMTAEAKQSYDQLVVHTDNIMKLLAALQGKINSDV